MNESNMFRLALRVSPEPIMLSRLRDDVLVDVSDSFCRLVCADRAELTGRRVCDLGLWVDPRQHEGLLRAVTAFGEVRDFEARLRGGDGQIRTHLIGAARVDAGPEPMLLTIGHDISERLALEQALRDSELRYRRFVESMPVGVLITQQGEIKYANPQALDLSGYTLTDFVGRSFAPMIHEDDRAMVLAQHARRMAGALDVSSYVARIRRQDGTVRHLRFHVQTVDWEGAPGGLSIISDITDSVQAQVRLRELSSIVEQTSDAIMLTGTDGVIQYVNPGFERMTGYARDEVLGRTPAMFKSGQQDGNFYRQLWETVSAGKTFHAQVANRRRDGSLYHATKTITPMFDGDGRIVSYVNIDMDASAQHEAQQRALRLATHDNLTGLPNRALLADRVQQAIAQHARERVPFALLFIDLDGFKLVNDRRGHQAGDEVLRQVARRLGERVRGVDTVARIGGDEFVVLLAGLADRSLASEIAGELVDAVRQPVELPDGPCAVGASVGIAVHPQDGDDLAALLASADQAMYEAKRAGGNRTRLAGAA
ncbi:MAG: PAS domain S-box protein [Rubrivivax sp.]|nr:PAS domain S-box protein [Rubrivivax sp.]